MDDEGEIELVERGDRVAQLAGREAVHPPALVRGIGILAVGDGADAEERLGLRAGGTEGHEAEQSRQQRGAFGEEGKNSLRAVRSYSVS